MKGNLEGIAIVDSILVAVVIADRILGLFGPHS